MARQNIPTQPSVRTVQYGNLLGVDYQSDPTEINRNRSPEMVNMISDLGGNPIKRCGYRQIGSSVEYMFEMGGTTYAITKVNWTESAAHPTIRLSSVSMSNEGRLELTTVKDITFEININSLGELKHVFTLNGIIYIFLEMVWVALDISNLDASYSGGVAKFGTAKTLMYSRVLESDNIYYCTPIIPTDESLIPTVYTLMKPNGGEMISIPAGTDITGATKGVNLLTPFRRIEYCVQADTVGELTFHLPTPQQNGFVSNIVKVEILTGSGSWETVASSYYSMRFAGDVYALLPDTGEMGVNSFAKRQANVIFNITPFVATETGITNSIGTPSDYNVPTTEPNLRITYAPFNDALTDLQDSSRRYPYGLYRKERCEAFASDDVIVYDGRLFVAVGSRVYYSRAGEPFSIDDNYYFDVDGTVTGLLKTPNGLGVVCKGSHPIYIASGSYSEDYAMPVYTVKASNANIGEVEFIFETALNDEPLILTSDGVYGISTNYLSSKYAIPRSGKINRRLCRESSTTPVIGVVHDNYAYISKNDHMYILDGRHKDASKYGDNSYESYFFDNMPILYGMWSVNGTMYFSDGTHIYTWNDDFSDDKLKYRDNLTWNSTDSVWTGGTPVKALWSSAVDGDGVPQYYKTLQKKGTMVTLSPPMQTSCQITLKRDGRDVIYVGRFDGSIFSLTDSVLDAFTKKKVKKYKRLQFIVENNEDEPFGIISIVKSFVLNNYAKR